MAQSDIQRLIHTVAELGRRVGNKVWHGTVEEVKKDRIRMNMGDGREGGEKQIGPWLDTGNHRGGSRERLYYKKGQNVTMFSPTGDPAQAMMMPFAPNKDFGPPDHAGSSGQGEDVYQQDDLRVRKKGDGYEIWLEPASKKNGQADANNTSDEGGNGGNGANEKVYLKKGQVTGRVGKNWFVAHKKGAKLQADKQFACVTSEKLVCSKEWEIGKDPIGDVDDKGSPGKGDQSQSSATQGTGA
jgi:hypothetical protein